MPTEYQTSGDIRMTFDAAIGHGDLTVVDRDLERDPGLETAVIVSLFSNARAADTDALPDDEGSKEGWWADALDPTDPHGSKLWLLGRAKVVPAELLPRAEQFATEALQWMIDDKVASSVTVTASRAGTYEIRLDVEIVRPEIAKPKFFTYYFNWIEQIARSG